MTKEQFEEIVRAQMQQVFAFQDVRKLRPEAAERFERAMARIIEQWESDVNDARIAGQDEATSAIENYSPPCMGPCCGGSI